LFGIMLMKASNHESPMAALTRGACVHRFRYVEDKPSAWLHFYACGVVVS
jgi:hypothetical protein